MANSSLTPNTKQEQDEANDPVRRAKALHDAEQRQAFDRDFENPERLAKDGKPGDLAGGALKKEQDSPQTWKNNVTAAAGVLAGTTGQIRGTGNAKSKSPIVAIIIIIFGGGFTFAGLLSAFSLLPISVVSQFFNKEDAQNTSLTIRTNMIINDKISKDVTNGFCSTTRPLLCKYEKPSNKLLKALAKEGVQAFGKSGNLIDGKGKLPNTSRPDYFTYTDSKGYDYKIPAKDFSNTLKNDPEFRARFHNAYTPKFIGYADNIFQAIKARFGFTTSDKNSGAKNSEDLTNNLNEESAGAETGATAAEKEVGAAAANAAEAAIEGTTKEEAAAAKEAAAKEEAAAAEAADGVVKTELIAEGTGEVKAIAKEGKGNAVGLIAGAVCAAGDIPGLIISVVRAYQLAQIITYGASVLTSIMAWKAGDATSSEVTALGNLFTATVGGQSAMSSAGMKSVLFGDIPKAGDTSVQQFSPGAQAESILGEVSQVTSSVPKKEICSVATNPATGLAIDTATSETIAIPLINAAVGTVAAVGLEFAGPTIVNFVVSSLPPGIFQPFLKFFLGDLTKGAAGPAFGNLFSSALLHLMGQTANRGGNVPLSIQQKLAYDGVTSQVNLAYAQEDRATHSPLDASNPNTMLGSFVSQLLPYYSNLSSVGSVVSTLGSIITGSVSSVIKQSTAGAVDASGAQYSQCPDPAISSPINGSPIAAGPFCNIEYGIPPEYLSKDPESVASDLLQSGDINANTGDPIDKPNNPIMSALDPKAGVGSLSAWIALCGDGKTTHAAECELSDDNVKANPAIVDYALYTVDHRVQTTMDGEDATLDPSTAPAAEPAATDTTATTTDTPTPPVATTTTNTATSSIATTDTATPSSYLNTNTNTASPSVSRLFGFLGYWLPAKRYEGTTI